MNVSQLHCPNCGSQLHISDDDELVTCAYCSTQLVVTRTENSIMLQMGETLRDAITDSSSRTQAVIEQSAYVTRDELRRVQLTQQYSNLRLMLANLQAEIRELEREDSKYRRSSQYRHLRAQEAKLQSEFLELRKLLYPEQFQAGSDQASPTRQRVSTPTPPLSEVVKWLLLWPFLIAGILWRQGAIGKVFAVFWALMVWPIYLYLPLALCNIVAGA